MKELSKIASKIKESSTLSVKQKANLLKASGVNVVNFTTGELDFDTPDYIKDACKNALDNGDTKYTATNGTLALRKAICSKLKNENGLTYEPENIVVSNGAKHSLFNIMSTLLNKGDEVILIAPFWLSYQVCVEAVEGVIKVVHTTVENNFLFTSEDLEKVVSDKTKAIIINSPNNPTGAVYNKELLMMVGDFAKKYDLYIISDEIYEKIIYNGSHISIGTFDEDIFNRTILVNGLSKSHSMTGWRIGYTASNKEIATIINNFQSHTTSAPNTLAQTSSVTALLEEDDSLRKFLEVLKERRQLVCDLFSSNKKINFSKPDGAFYVLIKVTDFFGMTIEGKTISTASDVAEILIDKYRVAVVPCEDFCTKEYFRISFTCSIEEIKEGISRISQMYDDYL